MERLYLFEDFIVSGVLSGRHWLVWSNVVVVSGVVSNLCQRLGIESIHVMWGWMTHPNVRKLEGVKRLNLNNTLLGTSNDTKCHVLYAIRQVTIAEHVLL